MHSKKQCIRHKYDSFLDRVRSGCAFFSAGQYTYEAMSMFAPVIMIFMLRSAGSGCPDAQRKARQPGAAAAV